MLAHRNLYQELHLQPTASASEIRSAYRRAALLAHPDKGGKAVDFHSIAFAFEVLSCQASRDMYDRAYHQWSKSNLIPHSACQTSKIARKERVSTSVRGSTSRCKRKRESMTEACPAAKQTAEHPVPEDDSGMATSQSCRKSSEPCGDGDDPHPAPGHVDHKTFAVFKRLQNALQDFPRVQRRAVITQLPQLVRIELLKHMSSPGIVEASPNEKNFVRKHFREDSWNQGTDVRTINYAQNTTYQAQMRIRHLRMYTSTQVDLDAAISIQMVLVQARHAIDAAGDDVWDHPEEFSNVFNGALVNAGTSQEQLGLSVFIYMRADEWISRCTWIASPVMPLRQAVAAHSRLMIARQISWDNLKAEWVLLMQLKQHARLHRLTKAQAEAIAENARMKLLQKRLRQAVQAAERAIHLHQRRTEKMHKARAKLQQIAAKQKAKAAAVEARAARKNNERKLLVARRRWYQRVDLTMDEILHGVPRACL